MQALTIRRRAVSEVTEVDLRISDRVYFAAFDNVKEGVAVEIWVHIGTEVKGEVPANADEGDYAST